MFALVDCNNFYASCERVFNPNLLNKPVVILSNNDGCVISRSDEAKKLIPMGAPAFKFKQEFKKHNIDVLSSNYPLYGDMSERVMSILHQFTPDIEVYSIDEAFLEFKGFDHINFENYGIEIRNRINQWVGIPTCVGIAPTKSLSKVANKIARKFPQKTNGVYIIDSEEKRLKALKWTPIEKVWGIGHRLQKRLKVKGCTKAIDFVELNSEWVRKNFSITEWKLQQDLKGISKLNLDENTSKKAIATTRSFESTFSNINDIKERVSTFAISCAEKLRKQHSCCYMIIVTLSSNRYQNNIDRYKASKTIVLSTPTNSSLVISKQSVKAVETIFKKGVKFKRAGVIVTGLVPNNNYQLHLFEKEPKKHVHLMKAIDKVNKKYKSDKIKLARQDLKRTWKMKQEHLSPKYTTNINEIIKVK
ncbi:DNA polymerase V [Tenacibaculum sp. 190524A02b]|uniref:DNA polymerase V n=1 Tax=Tenacibaculum vairaonense TaxID=3137860 RepID=A0ABP1F9L3_9FLAO